MEKSVIELLEQVTGQAHIVDLTHTMESGMPAWPTQARYGAVVYESYDRGDMALHSMVTFSEHTGTHIDAPKHYIKDACPINELPLTRVIGRGVTIDATSVPPRGVLPVEKIKEFEAAHGPIRKGDIVMFRFGWDLKYRLQPDCHDYLSDWPGLSSEAAEYLCGKAVAAVGCDALALDAFGNSMDDPAHHILLGQGIPIIENIDKLSGLPPFCFVIGLPNKFKDGSGSPLRLIAFVD
ncbi:cyclase family protein [Treponema primitia]|uniref:cyclase family protein n=1 Tax=Treponema primitia TaxID=88058 RepID=UPI00397F444C